MERDFMGLICKDSVVAVKEEFVDGDCQDSAGFARNSSAPWQFPNKVPSQLDEPSKNGHSPQPIHDFKNMHTSSMMSSPFFKTRFMGAQQFLGANTPTPPRSILPPSGTTEQWTNSKASTIPPPKLTIFYNGTVNVFDDITPEKAQAIMFLAGNGFMSTNMGQSKHHMQAPVAKLPAGDRPSVSQSMNMPPSPMSISSHPVDVNNDEAKVTAATSATLVNKVETPRVMSSLGSVSASAMISSAVPQARKASLARFLEKRKERAMSAAPYNVSKKAGDCATPESNGFGFSATSGNCAL
ncbi:hypothetical protein ABFS82_05G044600 [Erythranthe guttata]|uniref:Protein TIFY n=1 Tax=Erythranthe guttata TaxID=4155 RepID=A0A022QS51_ERYGU|nr:PREDICTED: protein TIFY 7 [Erythranthe guttata]EYU30108.1 hypothetical protein MIMGU_mgv1a010946mg [Erythranthe guttata]|eukprot:XP_012846198.1 PREDICTED: protein TIFY 7 [Erythranthe guttata]